MLKSSELRRLIKLNQQELLFQTKEYFGVYLLSIISDPKGKKHREILLEKWKEYQQIIKEENKYLNYIIKNHEKIRDWEEASEIIDDLDILNQLTYIHYDNILKEYEEMITSDQLTREMTPSRNFKTLLERTDYLERILGLTLTEKDLETYYQKEPSWNYLKEQTKILSGTLKDTKAYFGCYPQIEEDILIGIKICVPPITNLESMKINIHAKKEEETYRTKELIKRKF